MEDGDYTVVEVFDSPEDLGEKYAGAAFVDLFSHREVGERLLERRPHTYVRVRDVLGIESDHIWRIQPKPVRVHRQKTGLN